MTAAPGVEQRTRRLLLGVSFNEDIPCDCMPAQHPCLLRTAHWPLTGVHNRLGVGEQVLLGLAVEPGLLGTSREIVRQ